MAEKLIYDILKGKDTLTPALKNTSKVSAQTSKNVDSIGKSASRSRRSIASLAGSIGRVSTAAVAAGTAIATAFGGLVLGRAVQEAVALENSLIGLSTVARATGNDVGGIKQIAQELASDGIVPLNEVAQSLKNLLNSGLDADKAVEAFKALREVGAFNRNAQLSLGEALVTTTEGIKNQNSVLTDNIGISENYSVALSRQAQSLGKSTAALNDQEKALLVVDRFIEIASASTGDYAALLDTFSGAQSKASGAITLFFQELGKIVTQSPEVVKLLNEFTGAVSNLTEIVVKNAPAISLALEKLLDIFLITPSKFWLNLLGDGIETGRNVAVVRAEIEALEKSTDKLQKSFAQSSQQGGGILDSFFGLFGASEREQSLQRLSDGLVKLTAARKELAQLEAQEKGKQEGDTATDRPENDPRVKNETAVNALLKQLADERGLLEDDRDRFRKEQRITDGEEKIAALQNEIARESEIRQVAADERLAKTTKNEEDLERIRKNIRQRQVKSLIQNEQTLLKAEEIARRQRIQAEQQRQQNFKSSLSTISTLSQSSNKELFAIGKAAGIANATIDGIAAVQKALASAPPPFNFALAATVGAATAANVSRIASARPPSFQDGGIVGGFNSGASIGPDNTTIRARVGEAVLNADQQKRLLDIANGETPVNEENQIERLIAAFNQPIILNVNGTEIARAIRDEVRGGFVLA